MALQDEIRRRVMREACSLAPVDVLAKLIAAVADDPRWQHELQHLDAVKVRIEVSYRRSRRQPYRTAASEWVEWFKSQRENP